MISNASHLDEETAIDVHVFPVRRAKEMAQSVEKGLTLQV